MPPKRKAGRGGGRSKRRREPFPDVKEQLQKRQRVDDDDNNNDNGAIAAQERTKGGSVKLLDNTLAAEGDEDADGEEDDDKVDATHDEDAEGEREDPEHLHIAEDKEQQHDDGGHEAMPEGEAGNHTDREVETTELSPSTSTRGRGRPRGRRTRGALPVPTRSSPRKGTQPPQAPATTKPTIPRGRKTSRGKGRGVVTSDPSPIGALKREEVAAQPRGEGKAVTEENEGHDKDVNEAEVTDSQQAHQHSKESPFQDAQQPVEDSQQQQSSQIDADHALQTPAVSFPSPAQAYYPNYPSQTGTFSYTYGAPPPPGSNASDARSYFPLRPDGTQPMYSTSFATTVGTGNESGSASSSFTTPYPPSGAPAHALDANAPQGNPFPPSGLSAYGTGVYGVGMSDDDDDEEDQEQNVRPAPTKRKTQTGTTKIGGRAGRGDHVACHFCRGRKLKCDGRRPTCGHCTLRSLACAYDETIRRRGPGRKEKNNRRDRNGIGNSRRAGGMVVPDMSIGPQTPTHPLMTTTPPDKRKRRHAMQAQNAAHQSQTSVLRFDEADGPGNSSSGMKPASAAYGVASNERLGYYYAGGAPGQYPPQGPSYPPYGAYGYAQDGEEDADGNAEIDGEGEGEGEGFGSRPEGESSYGHPSNGDYSQAWPAEPPGGVPVSHPHAQHM